MTEPARVASASLAKIEYEPELIEASVRWIMDRGAPGFDFLKLQRLRIDYRRHLDALYGLPDPERSETAFRRHFWAVLRELEIDSWIPQWLAPFPGLRAGLERVLVRSAGLPGEEGAELWETRERRGKGIPAYLVIAVPSPGLCQHDELRASLLPALLQAADLLDPRFDFRREDLGGKTEGIRERTRAIYRQFWDLSARVRLQRRGLLEQPELASHLEVLVAARARKESLETVSTSAAADVLEEVLAEGRHRSLLALTRELSGQDGASLSVPDTCPLCRFPTTDWAAGKALSDVADEIYGDFSGWCPSDGCCGHCAERYELIRQTGG